MKRSECLFICTLLLAMVACCGAFAGEGAEPEKKTPDTYFVSPHVDPTMEFDVQEVEIKGVRLKIPVLKGCTLESSLSGEGQNTIMVINILDEKSTIMILFFSIANITKDDGSLFIVHRAIVYKKYIDNLLAKDNAEIIEAFGFNSNAASKPIFESNYSNAFLFRTELSTKTESHSSAGRNPKGIIVVSNIAMYLQGYFFTVVGLDSGRDGVGTAIMTTWLDQIINLNK